MSGAGDTVSAGAAAVTGAGSGTAAGDGDVDGTVALDGWDRLAPARRGETRIADLVVAKVAVQAAREALRASPDARPVPGGSGHAPHASVAVHNHVARVRIALELGYPSDIGAQCEAVRRQVALRVRELVGMEVPEVTVGVERLYSEELGGETSGRVR